MHRGSARGRPRPLRLALVSALSIGALVSACAPKVGRLEVNRFQHDEFPYAVFYVRDGDAVAPLGGAFRVDNFSLPPGSHRYVPKLGPDYEIERRYDMNGDGRPELSKREAFYDLLLVEAGGSAREPNVEAGGSAREPNKDAPRDAVLWVRSVPVAPAEQGQALERFAERYLEAAAATGATAARFGVETQGEALQRRFTTRTLQSRSCSLSRREAYRVDFEVANGEPRRAAVVFVRTGYSHAVSSGQSNTLFPVVMALGLSAKPQDFAALEPEFDELLKQTVLGEVGKGLSMNGETTCGSTAPATSGAEHPSESPNGELNDAAQIPLAPEALPQP